MASSTTSSEITLVSSAKCFDGLVQQYKHQSEALKCEMMFHVFVPAVSEGKNSFPCLMFLSGLTCNDTNFITKAGALEHASKLGIALICPDTSPRGKEVPGAPTPGEWDFGAGAGFYLNATQAPYHEHYKMYDYIAKELPQLLAANESKLHMDTKRMGIFGHSMGGHGALTIFLKHRNLFKSCSAFAPICHPASPQCAWGQKAFKGYLGTGEDVEVVKQYDACLLMKEYQGPKDSTILIDQGLEDKFLPQNQLQPESFQKACTEASYPLKLRLQPGYDHSYWFIQTFIKDHLQHHAQYL